MIKNSVSATQHSDLTYDCIIVGQGIAGSMLAHFLLQQNKKILVIDKSYQNSASNIAAGVVNPITGRKMVKSWMIDEVLPFAKSVYKNLEEQLQTHFFYEQDIYKLFTSKEDIDIWNYKKNDADYENYLGDIADVVGNHISSPFGAGIIKQCYWMDMPVFITAYRNFLRERNYLLDETFNIKDLVVSENIRYKNIIAQKLIFCEGYKAYQNPYFNSVQFSLAKGEQFTIHAPDLKCDKMINKNIFILPKQNDLYSIGSTFIWNDVEETITENGRKEIFDKLNKIIDCNYTIMEEKAGIRPTVKDRRPVVGPHPDHSNLYIFNGLGTKGVTLAPYFAHYLTDHFVTKVKIMNEISVSRFF